MRYWRWGLLAAVLLATPVHAGQPRCPLSLGECMAQFGAMRERQLLVRIDVQAVQDAVQAGR